MNKIDVSDIQGFSLKGYNFPRARYLVIELLHREAAPDFVKRVAGYHDGRALGYQQ